MSTYKIYTVAAADAATAFQIELDARAIAAAEAIETSGADGAQREAIAQQHLGADYVKGYRGTAWKLHGISAGLTPARLARMLEAHGESFDACEERETFDYSLMVNVEEELAAQLEEIPEAVLDAIVEAYKAELLGEVLNEV